MCVCTTYFSPLRIFRKTALEPPEPPIFHLITTLATMVQHSLRGVLGRESSSINEGAITNAGSGYIWERAWVVVLSFLKACSVGLIV